MGREVLIGTYFKICSISNSVILKKRLFLSPAKNFGLIFLSEDATERLLKTEAAKNNPSALQILIVF